MASTSIPDAPSRRDADYSERGGLVTKSQIADSSSRICSPKVVYIDLTDGAQNCM